MNEGLRTDDLAVSYGDFQVLFGISIEIRPCEVVAIIGANGAGKTTLFRSIAGLLKAPASAVTFEGRPIGGLPAHEIVALGIAMMPEGRRLFRSLSVEENLKLGAYSKRPGPWDLARVYELFPVLAEKRQIPSGSLSGGQQQMVAIGRALMSNPQLLVCDEMSLGLAPVVVKEIYNAILPLTAKGMALALVEQDVGLAMRVSHRLYCIREGRISLQGASNELTREQVSAAYFGL